MNIGVDQVAGYLPGLILRKLTDAGWDRSRPVEETASGAVLFVDISGFTHLAKQAAQQGTIGLEQLSVILNTYFDTMISTIADLGGEVVHFAGDALLAVWSLAASGGSPALCTQLAVQCALQLQEALHDRELLPPLRLSLRSIVGAGEYRVSYVGGLGGRWELVLSGDAVRQITDGGPQALPGRVLLSGAAFALVEDSCIPEKADGEGGGIFVSSVTAVEFQPQAEQTGWGEVPEEALLPYLPPSVIASAAAQGSDWAAELRKVTVLFIHLPEFHQGVPVETIQQAIYAIQHIMQTYEGVINKVSLDDKGAAVIAGMGLPSLTHERNAARAVKAGLAVNARLAAMKVPHAIGIASGMVFCGSIGSRVRREYTMIGETVNLAARLMQAAEGGVLCDEATREEALGEMAMEPQGTRHFKGFAEPLGVFRPTGAARTAELQPQSMIGRSGEKAELLGRLDALLAGVGGTILISGEAGMGKSRLIQYVYEQAKERRIRLLAGSGDSIERRTPYFPWRSVFFHLLQLDLLPDDTAAAAGYVLDKVQSLVPSMVHLGPLLNPVLPFEIPDNERTEPMTGQARADNTLDFLTELLREGIGAAPTVIILDDGHWLDSASWTLLLAVSRQLPRVLLLLALRPDDSSLPAEYELVAGEPATVMLSLRELSERDTLQLLCDRLGAAALPEAVTSLILSKFEGHPFFSEEFAYALRDRGFIEVREGECWVVKELEEFQDVHYPPTIQGIIMSRIDRLPPAEQLVLKAASVIGRLFSYSALHGTLPLKTSREELSVYLELLEQVNMTVLEDMEPELTYLFKHIITQEVTYSMLLHSQRRQLHHAVAQWYERQFTDLAPYYNTLAHHWSKAGVTEKTALYLEKSGELALRTGAYQEAVTAFEELVGLIPEAAPAVSEAAKWNRLLGEAYMAIGDMAKATEQLYEALALRGRRQAGGPARFAWHVAGQLGRQLLHRSRPSLFIGRQKGRSSELDEMARCYFRLSEISFFINKPLENLYHSLHGLNFAETSGPSTVLAQITGNMCVTAGIMTMHPLAGAYRKQALEVAAEAQDPTAQAWVAMDLSLYHIGIGEWEDAEKLALEAIAIYDRIGNRRYWEAASYLHVKVLLYHKADFEGSMKLAGMIYDSGQRSGNAQAKSWGLLARAESLLYLERTEEALLLLQEAEALIPVNIGRTEEIRVYCLLAFASMKAGKRTEARHYARQGLGFIRSSAPTTYYSFDSYALLVEVFLELRGTGREEAVKTELQHSLKALQSFARIFPIAKPRLSLYRGTSAWLEGKTGKARQAWKMGWTQARQAGMPYEEGRAYLEAARRLQASDPEQAGCAAKASSLLEPLGIRL
ncbi:AAA family ATPase [Paenibacillus mucilaginosus]|uniref:AAA family ATPase n=1 Tax=Paenibacillus mucilaginosus TaxID=61624 RepID=UPI00059F417D|nr:adenylate/guanylate cyclase domain-containing protein [Paenibacillus mucilaginosus]MCG7216727.1 AAA family ATPase [Paenibacillus mucilaginosus]WDM25157.1 AAA family ATPase [Paenibacillus mucilaginosus]